MHSVLDPLLQPGALSPAELRAAALDGELYPLGEAFRPIDLPPDPDARAASLRAVLGDRLVAAGRTAAWVWGASHAAGPPYSAWLPPGGGSAGPPDARLRVREVLLRDDDVVARGGVRVASPLRAAIDLLCAPEPEFDREVVLRLLRACGGGRAALLAELGARPRLPGRRIALRRAQVLVTR